MSRNALAGMMKAPKKAAASAAKPMAMPGKKSPPMKTAAAKLKESMKK